MGPNLSEEGDHLGLVAMVGGVGAGWWLDSSYSPLAQANANSSSSSTRNRGGEIWWCRGSGDACEDATGVVVTWLGNGSGASGVAVAQWSSKTPHG